MTYQHAKIVAAQWAAEAGFVGEIRGKVFLLPAFDNEEDCRFFFLDRGLEFHQMVTKAAARSASKAGAKVILNRLTQRDYQHWLRVGGVEDSLERRGEYIKEQTKVA